MAESVRKVAGSPHLGAHPAGDRIGQKKPAGAIWAANTVGRSSACEERLSRRPRGVDVTDVPTPSKNHRTSSAGDVRITDLHVWKVGPQAHAAIVSVTGDVDAETVRNRLAPVRELALVTAERR